MWVGPILDSTLAAASTVGTVSRWFLNWSIFLWPLPGRLFKLPWLSPYPFPCLVVLLLQVCRLARHIFLCRQVHTWQRSASKGVIFFAFCEGRSTAMCRLCMWSTIAPFPGSPGGDQSEFLLWISCHGKVFCLHSWMIILKGDYDGVMKSPLMSTDLLGVVKQHLVPS